MAQIKARIQDAMLNQNIMQQQQQNIVELNAQLAQIVAASESAWDSTSGAALRNSYVAVNNILCSMANTVGVGTKNFKTVLDSYTNIETQNTQAIQAVTATFSGVSNL